LIGGRVEEGMMGRSREASCPLYTGWANWQAAIWHSSMDSQPRTASSKLDVFRSMVTVKDGRRGEGVAVLLGAGGFFEMPLPD